MVVSVRGGFLESGISLGSSAFRETPADVNDEEGGGGGFFFGFAPVNVLCCVAVPVRVVEAGEVVERVAFDGKCCAESENTVMTVCLKEASLFKMGSNSEAEEPKSANMRLMTPSMIGSYGRIMGAKTR